jgi:hypothetical protein
LSREDENSIKASVEAGQGHTLKKSLYKFSLIPATQLTLGNEMFVQAAGNQNQKA